MAPNSAEDVVQINVYGATLSDMLHKGVNIPRLLGKFGYDDCVVFDLPRRKQSSLRALLSNSSFDSYEETLREREADEQMREVICNGKLAVVERSGKSLLNCSISTIPHGSPRMYHYVDDSDEDVLSPVHEEVVLLEEDDVEGDVTRVAAVEEGDNRHSIFMNVSNSLVSFGSYDAACFADILERDDTISAPPINVTPELVGSVFVTEVNDLEAMEEIEGRRAVEDPPVAKEEETWTRPRSPKKQRRKRRASPMPLRPLSIPAIRTSFTAPSQYPDQLLSPNEPTCSGFDVSAQERTEIRGIPAIENADQPPDDRLATDPAPAPLSSTSSAAPMSDSAWAGQFFDPNPFPDDFLEYRPSSPGADVTAEVQRDDGGIRDRERAASTSGSQHDEFFDCTMRDKEESQYASDGGDDFVEDDDKQEEEQFHSPSKKPARRKKNGETERKYNCQFCREIIIWRPQYGRNRFLNHVRKHFERPTFKCQFCSFRASLEHKIRYHHRMAHPGVPYQQAVTCETPQDTEDLLQLWDRCFPGLVCPAGLNLGNIPLTPSA